MKKYLLFDLDGTLTDPKTGITSSVQYALRAFGIEEPDPDKLECFIGPPLRDSFMEFYGMSAEQAQEAVAKYRERFQDIGIFENEVYGGIPKMLRRLQRNGMKLAVASSKPQVFVERILEHFDLRKYFTVVVGSELDGTRDSKEQVVREALKRLFEGGPIRKEQVYMIGDRKFDVEGARVQKIESVGVTYGYGSMEELKEARADYIVRSVKELEAFLMRGVEEERENAGGKNKNLQGIRMILFSLLLFAAVRMAVTCLVAPGGSLAHLVPALSYLAAGLAIWEGAKKCIRRTAEETRLSHLRKDEKGAYVMLGAATVGAALGLNILLELLQVTLRSGEYQAVAEEQYAIPFWIGSLTFGLVSPVAEELLFRGIIHNCLRRIFPVGWALALSSALFGLYHGNAVQAIYGFLMGCLIAYAYEYFGDFRVAVAVHIAANGLIFSLSCAGDFLALLVNWPVCMGLLGFAGMSLWLLVRSKRVL